MESLVSAPKARSYLYSKENILLVPNSQFGRRKYISFNTMNRQTSFAKWAQGQREKQNSTRSMNKSWVHPPEALLRGHIVYNVKYLGSCEVDQPKGTEVVKDGIRKMKFNKQLKKAEGQKTPKVELTISADGVTIQDPKTKIIQHQYPLHRISYCADDKSDKRMFTFIAKENDLDKHTCHVFDSDKLAEEITLTVGQAFDLAYRRFLDTSGRDMDMKKQFLLLQKRVHSLQQENQQLKNRIADLEKMKDQSELETYKQANHIQGLTEVTGSLVFTEGVTGGESNGIKPPAEEPVVGRKLENLIFDDDFVPGSQRNGTATTPQPSQPAPILSPPPIPGRSRNGSNPATPTQPPQQGTPNSGLDAFGSTPFGGSTAQPDPFGMGAFTPNQQELDRQYIEVDKQLLDLQAGFAQGLSFGTDDFSLADLDPLNKK